MTRAGARGWLIRLVLAVAVMTAILSRLDRAALAQVLRGFDPRHGLAILAVFGLAVGLFAWRWRLIARALGIGGRYRDYLRGVWLGQALSELGPPLIVGEWARFHALRGQASPGSLLLAQLADRGSGQLVLWLMVLALLPSYRALLPQLTSAIPVPLLLAALLAAALVAALLLGARLRRRWPAGVGRLPRLFNPLAHPGPFLLSLALQGLLVLNWVLAVAGLGLDVSIVRVAWLAPLLLLGIGSLPGLVSDWGKREAAAVLLLMPAGLTPEQAVAASLIYGAAHLVVALPGGWAVVWPGKGAAPGSTEGR